MVKTGKSTREKKKERTSTTPSLLKNDKSTKEKKEEVTKFISNNLLPKEKENKNLMTFEEFEKLDKETKEKLEKIALERTVKNDGITKKFLLDLKKRSKRVYFNTIKVTMA